ncbi:MAG: hypothetical protein Q7O66_06420, partial [Dehalococcoidia bacterium]|nr:hypothetical protein [Dehalococcoidia bacterium]
MVQVIWAMLRALRLTGRAVSLVLNYLLAGGSLVAVIWIVFYLNGLISETRASHPLMLPITSGSLAKPIFVRSIPLDTPRNFGGKALSVSPDGGRIAYLGSAEDTNESRFYVARVDDVREYLVWPFVSSHSWSPDSNRLVLQTRLDAHGAIGIAIANTNDLVDAKTAAAIVWVVPPAEESAPSSSTVASAACWSPDGKSLLFVLSKASERVSELWRFDLENGQKQRLANLPKEADKPNVYVRGLSLSPDGKKVSFVNADRPASETSATWWMMNIDGSSPLSLMRRSPASGFVGSWQWFPDGRKLIYNVRTVGDANYQPTSLWTMNIDGTAVKRIGSSDNNEGFSLSPKENWAIYGQDSHLWMVNL